MQKRRLGRTGLQVSIIGFGSWPLRNVKKKRAVKVVRSAFESGINYFNFAFDYGNLHEKIGLGLEGVLDECILSVKINPCYKYGAWGIRYFSKNDIETLIHQTLHYVGTDKIDILAIHGVYHEEILKNLMEKREFLEAFKDARDRGEVDFLGISGHNPKVLISAIETGRFDIIQVPFNIATRYAAEELIPMAKRLDVGVTIMKPFGGETPCAEFKSILGKNKKEMANRTLRFVLAQDIDVVTPGLTSIKEVEISAEVGKQFKGLTEEERKSYEMDLEEPYCRNCAYGLTPPGDVCDLCLPCPEHLNIPAILRFDALYTRFGMKRWSRDQYEKISTKVDRCTKCGKCERGCPYEVPVIQEIHQAHKRLH